MVFIRLHYVTAVIDLFCSILLLTFNNVSSLNYIISEVTPIFTSKPVLFAFTLQIINVLLSCRVWQCNNRVENQTFTTITISYSSAITRRVPALAPKPGTLCPRQVSYLVSAD